MAQAKRVAKDTYLFREGDQPDAMYIIKSGAFAITKTKGQSEIVLAEMGPGQMVGEMALFDLKPRSANVKALKESEVVGLPYAGLQSQMNVLPVWLKAILRTLNDNLREANKKIKILETPTQQEERFPPHIMNKLISIINLVGHKYGKPAEDGNGISFSSALLRNYTIQIFQEATNKMQAMSQALTELGYLISEDRGDGTQKITIPKPDELFAFVEWHNEWIFKQEKDRLPLLNEAETKTLNGVLHFARKLEPNAKNLRRVNMIEVQNESMKEFGYLLKLEDVGPLIEKKYLHEMVKDEVATYIDVNLEEVEGYARNWTMVNELKKKLH